MSTQFFAMQEIDNTRPLTALLSAIHGGSSFLLTSHLRPDGDAVGSLSGLSKSLRKAGKRVDVALRDPVPDRFTFLLKDEFVRGPMDIDMDHDVVIVLDSGDISRTGFELENIDAVLVNIDHHASNTFYGDVNFVDSDASSTSEMLVNLLTCANLPMDSEIAEGLYLGLLTDSRFFQNENIRPSAHRAGEILLSTGLNTAYILNRLNSARTLSELRLLGFAFSNLKLELDGKLAYVIISAKDLAACDAELQTAFSCGIFNQLTSLEGVIASLGVVQGAQGKVFCEFRAKGGFNVKDIATAMGGGGHIAASGCNMDDDLENVANKAIGFLKKEMTEFLGMQSDKL